MENAKSTRRLTLSDAASECLLLIQQVRLATAIGDPGQLRARTLEVLKRFERSARDGGFESDQVQMAKFALVAFLDEAVAGAAFGDKELWTTNPLQAELFGLNSAGEEFFRRLNDLRQHPQANVQVLEVYYLCMVLGFKGRYQLDSPEVLRRLVEETRADLLKAKEPRFMQPLSPHAKPGERLAGGGGREVPAWAMAAAAAAVALIVFLILSWLISGATDRVKEMISMAG